MFFIFYICFLLQSFLAPLNSFAATLDDRRENLLSMLRQPLASLLSQSVTIQEATVRTHTPRKPLPSIDEESPSFDSSPATLEALAEERKSLQPFVEYLYHHIPTVMHSKPDLPPLNNSLLVHRLVSNLMYFFLLIPPTSQKAIPFSNERLTSKRKTLEDAPI